MNPPSGLGHSGAFFAMKRVPSLAARGAATGPRRGATPIMASPPDDDDAAMQARLKELSGALDSHRKAAEAPKPRPASRPRTGWARP